MRNPAESNLFVSAMSAKSLLESKSLKRTMRRACRKVDKALRKTVADGGHHNREDIDTGDSILSVEQLRFSLAKAEAAFEMVCDKRNKTRRVGLSLLKALAVSTCPFDVGGLQGAISPVHEKVLEIVARSARPDDKADAAAVLEAFRRREKKIAASIQAEGSAFKI
jgi:hypothetical protein